MKFGLYIWFCLETSHAIFVRLSSYYCKVLSHWSETVKMGNTFFWTQIIFCLCQRQKGSTYHGSFKTPCRKIGFLFCMFFLGGRGGKIVNILAFLAILCFWTLLTRNSNIQNANMLLIYVDPRWSSTNTNMVFSN